MPDDKTKVGKPDRSRVAADQDYEVQHFAETHGLSQGNGIYADDCCMYRAAHPQNRQPNAGSAATR